jgi:ABC-2 type transport system ATP-binding protein
MSDQLPPSPPPPPPPLPTPVADEPTPMIRCSGVSKFFGHLVAVSDVTFDIGPGVTALLGPNGAGKSTLLRLLTGQAVPSKGVVEILGLDPRRDRRVAQLLGVAPQQEMLFDSQTPLAFVALAATLQGVDDAQLASRTALSHVELDPDDPRPIATYSKGMRQRVKLAQAIVHDPRIVILDEPLTGLDPRQRLSMITLLKRLGSEGRCIVVSSHVLEEVERIGSRVLVIAKGRLAAEGDFHEIRALMNDRPHGVELRSDHPRELAMHLIGAGVVDSVAIDGGLLVIETSDLAAFSRAVAPIAVKASASLDEVTPLDEDLESVFRFLVGSR